MTPSFFVSVDGHWEQMAQDLTYWVLGVSLSCPVVSCLCSRHLPCFVHSIVVQIEIPQNAKIHKEKENKPSRCLFPLSRKSTQAGDSSTCTQGELFSLPRRLCESGFFLCTILTTIILLLHKVSRSLPTSQPPCLPVNHM